MIAMMFALTVLTAGAVGPSGQYQWSVALSGYISSETGKAPVAYLWIPEGCAKVKAVMLAQQNMTEEALFKGTTMRRRLAEMGIGLVWVAPWFSQNWEPSTGCQATFEEMMSALAGQSGHEEIASCPVIPFGHSAQATFPWNFAAWNNDRTLCVISFHGDAPRTNLCGYGTANVEWGRTRNIDGIPGLMVEGEYEWWEARVRPALAFRMMYPESCVSFLCDTGRGHFDCGEQTAEYLAKFIEKSIEQRLCADGTLRKVDPRQGWLASRFIPDLPENDGSNKGKLSDAASLTYADAAPWADYRGDRHDAFWYFDQEMAGLTMERYRQTRGKRMQSVTVEQDGKALKADGSPLKVEFHPEKDGKTFHLKAVYQGREHGKNKPRVEVICGGVEKVNDNTFRIVDYEAGYDNPRRCYSVWLCAVADADEQFKGAVQPITLNVEKAVGRKE